MKKHTLIISCVILALSMQLKADNTPFFLKETTGNLHMTAQEQLNLNNDINTNLVELGRFSNGAVDISVTDNSFRAVIKGIPMTSFRGFGLNLGFAF
ncbi:MAG: hypothetical protein WCH21_10510 [Bacteroidota bacterium]